MNFYENLEKILNEKNITTYKLSKDTKIADSTIRSWKEGKLPAIDKVITISRYFGISTDNLLGLVKLEYSLEEQKIIEAYRKADSIDKEIVKRTLKINHKTKENESSTSRTG